VTPRCLVAAVIASIILAALYIVLWSEAYGWRRRG
jgi:hypothetical protein